MREPVPRIGRQPHGGKHLPYPLTWIAVPLAQQWFGDAVPYPHPRVERAHRILEHELDLLPKQPQPVLAPAGNLPPCEADGTRGRWLQAAQQS